MPTILSRRNKPVEEDYDENPDDENSADDEEDVEDREEGIVDQFEAALAARGGNSVWNMGGPQKDAAIRVLIQCFGSMIESSPRPDALPDFKGRIRLEDMEHHKLLDASKHVVKARQLLIKNENFDTRDFTLFIAQKKWVKHILRPLLELCAREDSVLAMNCCSLALILVKKISEKTMKLAEKSAKKAKKNKALKNGDEGKSSENPTNGESNNQAMTLDSSDDENKNDGAIGQMRIQNAKDQLQALMSFKEALCSELCNQAITNAFRECWAREQVQTSEETKLGAARCISYLRRILSIAPHSEWSTPAEILEARSIHTRYVVQLRVFLSLLPGIISDVKRSYHDDWLADVVLIIFYILDNFKAQELFLVWKTDALLANFALLAQQQPQQPPASPLLEDTNQQQQQKQQEQQQKVALEAVSKPVIAPARLKQQLSNTTAGGGNGLGGGLSARLLGERMQRERISSAASSRFSRFTSTYQVPLHTQSALDNLMTTTQPSHAPAKSTTKNTLSATTDATTGANKSKGVNASAALFDSLNSNSSNNNNSNTITDLTGDSADSSHKVVGSTSMILKDPFGQNQGDANYLPQARVKRNKRHLTFGRENDYIEASKDQAKLSEDGQQACVVVASLVESLTTDICFKSFVRRVNEDMRRDELRISPDMEWQYFSIVTKLLAYNRLKLEDEYRAVQARRQEASLSLLPSATNGTTPAADQLVWEPDLINVIDSLDKMSFTRVTFAMEHLSKKAETQHLVLYPMQMYTEMVCYLRILLESGLEGHHEIAIGALYRLFYTSQGSLDPLGKLLQAWKPASYSKAHLFALVELVHQTLVTLEAAKNLFVRQGIVSEEALKAKRRQQRKAQGGGKMEMDMEQYLLTCLRFRVEDYFKRLVSRSTVSLYVRLLQRVEQNDCTVNHRVYCFLQRMCHFELDNDLLSSSLDQQNNSQQLLRSSSEQSQPNQANSSGTANLGYMLFNLPTLLAIQHALQQEARLLGQEALVRLLRSIVRAFAELGQRNHLLFVEALYAHPHAHDHCLQLQSVYDAAQTAHALLMQNSDDEGMDDDDEKAYRADAYYGAEEETSAVDRAHAEAETEATVDKADNQVALSDDDEEVFDADRAREQLLLEKQRKLDQRRRKSSGKRGDTDTASNARQQRTRLKKRMSSISDSSDDEEDEEKEASESEDADDEEDVAGDGGDVAEMPSKRRRLARKGVNSDAEEGEDRDGEPLKATKHRKQSKSKNMKKLKRASVDSDEEGEKSDGASSVSSADSAQKLKRMRRRESRQRKRSWTTDEDQALRQLHRRYRGTSSIFISIVHELRELGFERTEAQVAYRVRELDLHMQLDDEDEDDNEGQSEGVLRTPPSTGALLDDIFGTAEKSSMAAAVGVDGAADEAGEAGVTSAEPSSSAEKPKKTVWARPRSLSDDLNDDDDDDAKLTKAKRKTSAISTQQEKQRQPQKKRRLQKKTAGDSSSAEDEDAGDRDLDTQPQVAFESMQEAQVGKKSAVKRGFDLLSDDDE